jgi:hypothetical protein
VQLQAEAADACDMNRRTWGICALVCGCAAVSGCGGQQSGDAASGRAQAQVRQFLPDANHIQCARRAALTRCNALVVHAWRKAENWSCEFAVDSNPGRSSSAGTRSCWSDNGSRESLRLPN